MSTKFVPTTAQNNTKTEQLLQQESYKLRKTNELLEKRVKTKTSALKLTNEQLKNEVNERIKTEKKLQHRLAFDQILTTISTQFINLATAEIDEGINQALEKVCTFTHYDRGYIYLFEENGRALKNSHEWFKDSSLIGLQDFRTLPADLFTNWIPQLTKQETIHIKTIADAEQEAHSENKLLAIQGVRSALIIPLVYEKETIGFFGLDSGKDNTHWPEENNDLLKMIGDIFVNALMRKKAESSLIEERNFAQQVMQTMGQGLLMADVDGVFQFSNLAVAKMLGYAPETLLGKTLLDFAYLEDHSTLIQAHMQRLEGKAGSYETTLIKANGTPVYVLINGVPNYDPHGKIIGSIATVTDLTNRREAEEHTEADAEELKAIYQAAIQLFKPSNAETLAKQIASIVINEFGFEVCGVSLLRKPIKLDTDRVSIEGADANNSLTWLARLGHFCDDDNKEIPLTEKGLVTTAVRRGEIIHAPDVTLDPRYVPHNTYTQSQLVIPLRAYNLTIGALDLQSAFKDGFDERSRRIITVFAEHAGLALETVRLYDELRNHTHQLEIQINKRKKIERALRHSKQRYQQLVETATDMIYRTDAEGYCTYANPVTIRGLGYAKEKDLIGIHYTDFIHPDFQDSLIAAYENQSVEKIPNTYLEFIALGKNSSEIWLGQNVQPILDQGKIIGFQALARDITKRRKAEEALQAQRDELNVTNAKLAKALRTKDEFLANMSHELRTPLNAILGKSEILLEGIHGPITEKQVASLHVIEESGRHLLELINDILDLAKIEAGKITLDIETVSVNHLCESSLQFVRQIAHKKKIKLNATIDPTLKVCQADERSCKQVLINLLSNAVKFTPVDGEVGLNVLHDAENETIQFQVWDSGIGISTSDMDQLFRPFVQLDSGLSRAHEGTGLGLSLVYRLTEMHGGSISLESQVGVGSCFTVTLPQNPNIDPAQLKNRAKTDHLKYGPLLTSTLNLSSSKPSILLVEDNESNIEMFSEYLAVWGCRLLVARSGHEALACAKDTKPDLILMDIQLPEMDGRTAVRQLRQEKASKNTPIIALTALAMHGDKERCLEAGANIYLSKPIQLRQLVMTIDKLLTKTHQSEGAP